MALVHDNPNTLGGNPTTVASHISTFADLYIELRRTTVAPGIWWFWTRVSWQVAEFGVYMNPILEVNGNTVYGVGWQSDNNPGPGSQWTSKAIGFDMTTSGSPREFTGWYGSGDSQYPPTSARFSVQARELDDIA